MTTTEPASERACGLPTGAADALAAALGPRLRNHPDRLARPQPWPGDEPSDQVLWDTAGRDELLDVLWDAGLLTVPGAAPRPPLYRDPAGLPTGETLVGMVVDAAEPVLREACRRGDPVWAEQAPSNQLVGELTSGELICALWDAGLLTFEDVDDRAHLRAGWAAMGAALSVLARHEDIPADLLARIPRSHVSYLLGQQALRQQARDAWARIEAAKMLLATIRDRADDDLPYLRTNLAVLQGLLAGQVHWSLTEPRDGGQPDPGSLYDTVRHRAAQVAVDAGRLFAAVGEAMLVNGQAGRARGTGADPMMATQHLFAHRAAMYAWATAGLLGYIRDALGDDAAADAAAIVDTIGECGDAGYVDDLPAPQGSGEYTGMLAAWTAGRYTRRAGYGGGAVAAGAGPSVDEPVAGRDDRR